MDDYCRAIKTLVMGDRRLKVQEIAREVGMLYGSDINMHEHLQGLCKMGSMFADASSEVVSH